MKRFFRAALRAARRPSQPIAEQKQIEALNLGCLVAVLLAFLPVILNSFIGFYILAATYLVSIFITTGVIVLQGLGC